MRRDAPTVVDFETEAIQARPAYPPRPVSVSVKEPGRPAVFWAWGHPSGNNCTREEAARRLRVLWRNARHDGGLLFHNDKFDVDVGETHLGLPRLPWDCYHDTMFLAFLDNPDRATQSLKPLGEEVLRRRPRERDKLRQWVLEHVEEARRKPTTWGAYISRAPAGEVAPYGKVDAELPEGIFARLMPRVIGRGMRAAYDRERRIMLPLLDSEREGMRVDARRLRRELPLYQHLLERADDRIRRRLKSKDLDVDKGKELADAMDRAGVIENWIMTKPSKSHPEGQRSTGKKALMQSLDDKRLLALLLYRNALATSVRTFMTPWLATAERAGGRIHTQWNQVRTQHEGADPSGARTGRLSSSPNFQNIPLYTRSVLILPKLAQAGVNMMDAETLRRFAWATRATCPLPMMKEYVLPDEDCVIVERDFSQQEFRILAHFEDGSLLARYKENPRLDVHDAARDLIAEIIGIVLDRRPVKDVGFSIIYGMGVNELARKTETDYDTAAGFKRAYLKAMPGLADLLRDIKGRARRDEPIVTWGGRQYFCEPPRVVDRRIRTFDYKLINRLVQGSAADCTKEALARYAAAPKRGGRFMLTVHDSKAVSAEKGKRREADAALREAMESVEFDVPMLTDGKWGYNLGKLKKIKD